MTKMDIPQDYADAFYDYVKADIRNLLTGALASISLSEESALEKIRQLCRSEAGYSDDLVRSMPEWRRRFDKPAKQEKKEEETEASRPVSSMSNSSQPPKK